MVNLFPNSFIDELDERRIRLKWLRSKRFLGLRRPLLNPLGINWQKQAELKEVDDQFAAIRIRVGKFNGAVGIKAELYR